MATKHVKAPVEYHFMVKSDGSFYLMKTASTGYEVHTSGEYTSQLSVAMEVKGTHQSVSTTSTTATTTSSSGRTTVTRTAPRRTTTTSTSSRTTSGGGY
jgi:hypothetical protein